MRLKARCDGSSVMAISMGVPSAAQMLRGVIAVGVDQAMLLTDRAFAGADTWATANALASAIGILPQPDLILCGRMATDGDTAQVGPCWPRCWTSPCDRCGRDCRGRRAQCCRAQADRRRIPGASGAAAALLSVTKEINVPRLPSIAGVLRGAEAEVQICSAAQLGVDPARVGLAGSVTKVVRHHAARPPRQERGA